MRGILSLALMATALLAFAAPAGADPLPGENGRIVFASGRTGADNDDSGALLHLLPVPFSTGGGTVSPTIVNPGGQYRHPSWSPDRTKIVFANGTADNNPVTQNFDLFVIDIAAGTGPFPITDTGDSLSADRPAWSPDGTRIIYEHQPTNNDQDRILRVQSAADLSLPIATTDVTSAAGPVEGNPAWTPDSSQVYYTSGSPRDILRKPPTAGGAVTGVLTNAADEYQPSISPDGTKMCFTETAGGNIRVVSIPTPGTPTDIAVDGAISEYNCNWSPDGQKLAFVRGAFSQGALVIADSDGSQAFPDVLTDDANNFDGNPSWAPDGRPLCPDSAVTTPRNTPITLNLECTDTGPAYERTDPNGFVANNGGPANGTVSDGVPLANPSTVRYTPNQNFTGTDTVRFTSFDGFGFGTDQGTITITVRAPATPGGGGGAGGGGAGKPTPAKPKCGGKTATIVGTAGTNRLRGTRRADVIVGLGGNDTITGGGGKDVICAGSGRDRVSGGSGNDRIAGGSGNDRLAGEGGNDSVKGESGNDSVSGGSGNDSLGGGAGKDRIVGGAGKDRLQGNGGRDKCLGGPGRDRASGCE